MDFINFILIHPADLIHFGALKKRLGIFGFARNRKVSDFENLDLGVSNHL